jgi:hypothetical protein
MSVHDGEFVPYFTGIEVEKSPAHGMKTLFVSGFPNISEIGLQLKEHSDIKHIYFGANMSFAVDDVFGYQEWDDAISYFLKKGYWCTLDFDISEVDNITECAIVEYRRFIAMISAKLPYINQLGYHATLKLDDSGFEATNSGVWCHSIHKLMDPAAMTDWDAYSDDEAV